MSLVQYIPPPITVQDALTSRIRSGARVFPDSHAVTEISNQEHVNDSICKLRIREDWVVAKPRLRHYGNPVISDAKRGGEIAAT
jgi:hypothetical protein